tara:strand:- start:457 stop:2652 length:2196 start_codon:yes stop_codon:yes gene_type:complete
MIFLVNTLENLYIVFIKQIMSKVTLDDIDFEIQDFAKGGGVGQYGPLYHYVKNDKIFLVLRDGIIKGSSVKGDKEYGVSTTRNPYSRMARHNENDDRLVLDQNKLRRDGYKIVPFDYLSIAIGREKEENIYKYAKKIDPLRKTIKSFDFEYEEVVLGDIKPLKKYLLYIDISFDKSKYIDKSKFKKDDYKIKKIIRDIDYWEMIMQDYPNTKLRLYEWGKRPYEVTIKDLKKLAKEYNDKFPPIKRKIKRKKFQKGGDLESYFLDQQLYGFSELTERYLESENLSNSSTEKKLDNLLTLLEKYNLKLIISEYNNNQKQITKSQINLEPFKQLIYLYRNEKSKKNQKLIVETFLQKVQDSFFEDGKTKDKFQQILDDESNNTSGFDKPTYGASALKSYSNPLYRYSEELFPPENKRKRLDSEFNKSFLAKNVTRSVIFKYLVGKDYDIDANSFLFKSFFGTVEEGNRSVVVYNKNDIERLVKQHYPSIVDPKEFEEKKLDFSYKVLYKPKVMFHGVRKKLPNYQTGAYGDGIHLLYDKFMPTGFNASYFTDNLQYAKFYSGDMKNMPKPNDEYTGFIYTVFLDIKKPIDFRPLGFEASRNDVKYYLEFKYGIKIEGDLPVENGFENIKDQNKKFPVWSYIRNGQKIIELIKDYNYDGIIQIGDVPKFKSDGEPEPNRDDWFRADEYLTFYGNQVKLVDINSLAVPFSTSYYLTVNELTDKINKFERGGYVTT